MSISKTADGIYKLTTNMEGILFEGIWEMPHGVALNSYVVRGEKTAIIDGFCGWDGVPETFFKMLDEMEVDFEKLDYVIINHIEPDHSGWIDEIKALKPDVEIICTKAAENLLKAFYGEIGRIRTVRDDDVVDLGGGRRLIFYCIPNVHWPDAMVTFDEQSGALFTCDAFGSFGLVEGEGYDEALSPDKRVFYEREAVRYYANIIATFSPFVKRAIEKCEKLPIKIIAPGHGIVWRKDPEKIIEDYRQYASYASTPARREVVLIWGSMYGMTQLAVKRIIETVEKSNVVFKVHQVPETSWGTVLASVLTATGVILAMPTYENKMFPPMAAVLDEIGKKKIQDRIAFRTGSYGWSGGAERELEAICDRHQINWQFLPSVEFKGKPSEEELDIIEKSVIKMIKEIDRLFTEKTID